MKTLTSDISEAYKVQVDCLKDSGSNSYDKNVLKQKVNDLARNDLNISKTCPKKGTNIITEKLRLVTNVHEDDNFSR